MPAWRRWLPKPRKELLDVVPALRRRRNCGWTPGGLTSGVERCGFCSGLNSLLCQHDDDEHDNGDHQGNDVQNRDERSREENNDEEDRAFSSHTLPDVDESRGHRMASLNGLGMRG